jgi:hypothetical protein
VLITTLQWISAVAAGLAAIFWLASAVVPIPKPVTVSYGGGGSTGKEILEAMRRQSWLNAGGAVSAAVSVVAQAVALWNRPIT